MSYVSIPSRILSESTLSLSQASKLFPSRHGRSEKANPATLWRWCTRGIKARDGSTVVLESCTVGGLRITSREAIARFVEALNPTTIPPESTCPAPSTKRSKSRADLAGEELERMGA